MAVPQSFPAKIYQILENESRDIIQWNENGVSFRIVDHGRFEREIVPKYFRRKIIVRIVSFYIIGVYDLFRGIHLFSCKLRQSNIVGAATTESLRI